MLGTCVWSCVVCLLFVVRHVDVIYVIYCVVYIVSVGCGVSSVSPHPLLLGFDAPGKQARLTLSVSYLAARS